MKVKTLALLIMSAIFFAGCNTAPVENTTEDTDIGGMEMDMEGEANLLQTDIVAANLIEFDQSNYEAALAEGKDVFLDFHANWCSTCASNAPKIEAAFDDLGDDNILGFVVNYDTSSALQKKFGVFSQSTLILISGGDTDSYTTLGPGLLTEDEVLEFLQS